MPTEPERPHPLDRKAVTLGKMIASARKRLGVTQSQLAEAVGISQSAITDWETGKTRPRPKAWIKLDAVLGTYLRYKAIDADPPVEDVVDIEDGKAESFDFPSNADAFSYICKRVDVYERYYECSLTRAEYALIASKVWWWLLADPSRDAVPSARYVDNSIVSDIGRLLEDREREKAGLPPR